MIYPFKTNPIFKDYIWGGKNLRKMGKETPDGNIAESWELSAFPGYESRIANGIHKDLTITEYIEKNRESVMGEIEYSNFPLLLKFIDANKDLSIQVHPDDDYAKVNENGKSGKTEMWYIIDAKPDAKIIHGFNPTKSSEEIKNQILNNDHKNLYQEVPLSKGDIIFIPSGTVHALKDGVIVAEIQQHSDITYRIYDYDRVDSSGNKRPLHVKKALDVLDFSDKKPKYPGLEIKNEDIINKYLVLCKYFCIQFIKSIDTSFEFSTNNQFSVFMILEGYADIYSSFGAISAGALETVFIPAGLSNFNVKGNYSALYIHVPKNVEEVYSSLIKNGHSHEEIIENVAGLEI